MVRQAGEQVVAVAPKGGVRAKREGELSPAKRAQIVAGARAIFTELGYERASVDAIAVRAGVSKATIYNHFRDKQELFVSILGEETVESREQFHQLLETPSGDIEADLWRIGRHLLTLVCEPANVRRLRWVSAEVERFPELGRQLYASTMSAGRERMVRFFGLAAQAKLLDLDSPEDAATDFTALLIHALHLKLQLGVLDGVDKKQRDGHVERAVKTFLRAYLPRSKGKRERA